VWRVKSQEHLDRQNARKHGGKTEVSIGRRIFPAKQFISVQSPMPIKLDIRPRVGRRQCLLLKAARPRALRFRLAALAAAILVCALGGCGGSNRDIAGKWRSTGDTTSMVWEFSRDGSVQMGSMRGRYSFGDRGRVKIETSSAISVYQMELSGDHLTLKDPSGSKLEFTRVR